MSKTLVHYFKKHCGKILWKYQFMFYFLQFSLPPDSKLRAKPFIFLCKLESRCFFCLWYKLKVIREMMLRGLERQRCQGVAPKALRKGPKISPEYQKGEEMGWGEGAISERGSEQRLHHVGPQSFQITLLLRQGQKQQSIWTWQGPCPQPETSC